MKTFTLNKGDTLTSDQLNELEEALKYPIVFDEDCEELSRALMDAYRCNQQPRLTHIVKEGAH